MMYNKYSDTPANLSCAPDKMIIQKSHPLLALWKSPLTLPEFKILDLYLSRIDSRHPERRFVHFNKGEIEHLLEVSYLKPEDLKSRLRNLCITVEIPNENYPKGLDLISLFERAICIQDDDGLWQVDLECTRSAMKYIFNVDNIGYIKYKLQAICNLSSRYTYILFLYLEQNRFRGSWEEDLEFLLEILSCTSDFYKSYKQFNQHILRRCQAELLKKTECRFSYSPVRVGRRVQKIQFHMEDIGLEARQPGQIPAVQVRENYIELLRTACCDARSGEPEFSHKEMTFVLHTLQQLPADIVSQWATCENDGFALYNYLADQYLRLNELAKKRPIRDRFFCLLELIKEDIESFGVKRYQQNTEVEEK